MIFNISLLLSSYSRCIPNPATIVKNKINNNNIKLPPGGRETYLQSTNNPDQAIYP